jgi:hypothetical protein
MLSITQVVVDQDEERYLDLLKKLVISSDLLAQPRYNHGAMVKMANVVFQNVKLSRTFIAVCRNNSELEIAIFEIIAHTFARANGSNTQVQVQSEAYYQRSQDRIEMSYGDPDSDI